MEVLVVGLLAIAVTVAAMDGDPRATFSPT